MEIRNFESSYMTYIGDVKNCHEKMSEENFKELHIASDKLQEEMRAVVRTTRIFYYNVIAALKKKNKHSVTFNVKASVLNNIDINGLVDIMNSKLLSWTIDDKAHLLGIYDFLQPKRIIIYNTINICTSYNIKNAFKKNKLKRATGISNNNELTEVWQRMKQLKHTYNDVIISPLCYSCLPLVIDRAKKFNISCLSPQDKIAYGNVGLLKAAHMFDFTRNVTFLTYASNWIKQSIMDGGATELCSVKVSSNMKQIYFSKTEKTEESENIITIASNPMSINADNSKLPFELLDTSYDIENIFIDKSWDILYNYKFKDILTHTEYVILGMSFGLFKYEEQSVSKIAERFNISRFYVDKHISTALEKLRSDPKIFNILKDKYT